MNEPMFFPYANGVVCAQDKSLASASINNKGMINIYSNSYEQKKDIIFSRFFFRGIYNLIFMFIFYIKNYKEIKMLKNQEKDNNLAEKLSKRIKISKNTIFFTTAGIIGVVVCLFLLGYLPLLISSIISPLYYFWKKFVVGIVKVLIFYFAILSLKLIPVFSQFCRFNGASNVASNNYNLSEMKVDYKSLKNYFVFVIFGFISCFFVLSLFGITADNFFKVILNILLSLIIFGLSYELLNFLDRYELAKKIFNPIIMLVTSKPLQSEIVVAQTALNEVLLMNEMDNRDFILEENSSKLGFSYVFTQVKEKLKSASIYDKSEAEWLIANVLGKTRGEIKLLTFISKDDYKKIKEVTNRRIKGEPLTKIFGFADFYGLRFKVTKDVLSPRMETELLVSEVLKDCKKGVTILDIGTGSGAIAISVAKNSESKVYAVDISSEALLVAKENAINNGVKIEFVKSDLFNDLKKKKMFDIIVSNPPYIKSDDIDDLMVEVKDYDPMLALDGGKDGLEFYREILRQAPEYLKDNGKLMFEVGKGQASQVKKLMQKDFVDVVIIKDYNKIGRIVKGTKKDSYVRENKKDKRKI